MMSMINVADFSNLELVARAARAACCYLRPPPKLKPSEWAEKNVRIPAGNAVPGLMRLDNAPYQREPMDMAVDPDCYRITLMWGAQVGKTMLALCIQGYHIAAEPASQMMMQPSQDDLRTWLETKFNPMAEECDSISNVLAKPRGRDGVNNQKMKSYPGGFLMFAWAGSPKTMRGRSAPKIVCDEVDGYLRTVEGHPVGLLWQRSATFGDQRFLVEISTPTIKGASYIESAYEMGDQRHFFVCCPHCDDHVTIEWEMVHWDGQRETHEETLAAIDEQRPDSAHLYCPSCGSQWSEGERIAAIRQAESKGAGWKSSRPFDGHASYHLNEFYSVFRTVPAIVRDYLDKLRTGDLQTFTNVSLARTWEEEGDKVDPDSLMARREEYAAAAPMGVLYITAGVDMQPDRLEVEIVGWGTGEESWSLGYVVIWGDPLTPDPWDALDDLLAETWLHESGAVLPISAACLDTGGAKGNTQAAYDYARGRNWGGGCGDGGRVLETAILQQLGNVQAAVPLTALQTQAQVAESTGTINNTTLQQTLMLGGEIARSTLAGQQGFANVKDAVQASFAVLNSNIAQVGASVNVGTLSTAIAIRDDGDKTRALISSIDRDNLNRQLTVAENTITELRLNQCRREDTHGIEIAMTNNQNQNQLQFQAQAQGISFLHHGLAECNQLARATNQNVLVGNQGVTTTGPQTANPTNVKV